MSSTSKSKFQPNSSTASTGQLPTPKHHTKSNAKSVASFGSGSKRVVPGVNPNASGYVGTSKSSTIQIIVGGVNRAPHSLISRKSSPTRQNQSTIKRSKDPQSSVPTIDETTISEENKPSLSKGKKLDSMVSNSSAFSINKHSMYVGSSLGLHGAAKLGEETSMVRLNETETVIQFSLTSYLASSDVRDFHLVEDRNNKYEAVIQSRKNVDGFSSRPTQTLNNPLKHQGEMAAPNATADFGCQAMAYDIIDASRSRDLSASPFPTLTKSRKGLSSSSIATDTGDMGDEEGGYLSGLSHHVRRFVEETVGTCLVAPYCLLDDTDLNRGGGGGGKEGRGGAFGSTGLGGRSKVKTVSSSTATTKTLLGGGGGGGASGLGVSEQIDLPSGSQADVSGGNSNLDLNQSGDQTQKSGDFSRNSGGGVGGGGGGISEQDTMEVMKAREIDKMLSSPVLLKRLQLMERAVQQNAYFRQHMEYRDLPDLPPLILTSSENARVVESSDQLFGSLGIGKSGIGLGGAGVGAKNTKSVGLARSVVGGGSKMDFGQSERERLSNLTENDDPFNPNSQAKPKYRKLFNYFNAELVQDRSVTCMCWNPSIPDSLAVGYGRLDKFVENNKLGELVDEQQQGGLVLFWSLRNPDYPEKVLRTAQPVTALDYSRLNPHLLAVGLLNGDVNVYNVKREVDWGKPVESSVEINGGHSDPVWQLKWVVRGQDRSEVLVSISTDGNVLEWGMKKGLVVSSLMQLKRSNVGEGWISRQAAGLCFDFLPNDPSLYLAGTEEGTVHRCSVSYNEQYLETYDSHEAPVHRIRCCARWPALFLSCSADWNIHLYSVSQKTPLLVLRCAGEESAINDVTWCHGNSTVFAAATSDAKLQIWDLSVSSLDPVLVIDTNQDLLNEQREKELEKEREGLASRQEDDEDGERVGTASTSVPPTPNPLARFDSRFDATQTETRDPPVSRLIKALTSTRSSRSTLCLLFGEKSPILVVGDSLGMVTLYRVYDPILINHLGPMQQQAKLKNAVAAQTGEAGGNSPEEKEKGSQEEEGHSDGADSAPSSVSEGSHQFTEGEEGDSRERDQTIQLP